MEVFLSKEVIQSLAALQSGLPGATGDGFLIGHKRGSVFFVEKAVPSQKGFFFSWQNYFELSEKLDDKICGFYSFRTSESRLKKILSPLAYGKIFLRLEPDHTHRLGIESFVIAYDREFFLQQIELKSAR